MSKINLLKWFGPTTSGLLMLLLIVIIAVTFPFLFIYIINTLFPVAAIPYNFQTWCAVVLLDMILKTRLEFGK
jgi:hypothetical protein